MTMKNRKILILGGMGFIGSNLAIRLVREGADVTIADSMLPQYGGNLENLAPVSDDVKISFTDIRDTFALRYLVQHADVIYSVAGQTSHIDSMSDPFTDLNINCVSQLSLLEACREYNPEAIIVYASTRQIYGRPQYLPVDENHPICPVDVNGINKLAAEEYFRLYSDVYGLKCISLRLTNTYGPRQQLRGNKQGFAGVFIRQALSNEKIRVFGTGLQKRDFNYIDDVVDAFLVATDTPVLYGKACNLGDVEHYSLLEFIDILQRHTGCEYDVVPFPDEHKKIDIGDYYSDFSLFQNISGWRPKVQLEEGLKQTVEYFEPRLGTYT